MKILVNPALCGIFLCILFLKCKKEELMKKILFCNNKEVLLERFPKIKNESLRAWDAADEYVLNYLANTDLTDKKVLIINDTFGALTLHLKYKKAFIINDSFCSLKALENNARKNKINPDYENVSETDTLSLKADLVIYRIPKKLDYLAYQLDLVNFNLANETELIAAGMVKYLNKSYYDLFSSKITNMKSTKAVKKARIIYGYTKLQTSFAINPYLLEASYPEAKLKLLSYPNCFSAAKADIGSRYLLNYLPVNLEEKRVADLGCGNGILALFLAKRNPGSAIFGFDESFMAVESAKLNAKNYNLSNVSFKVDNMLNSVAGHTFDFIVCNPPFHQNNTVLTGLAFQMFKDAKRTLVKDGELRLVFNRHLPYLPYLKRIFRTVELLAQNSKFIILRCLK